MNELLCDFYERCSAEAQNVLGYTYPLVHQDDHFYVLFLQTSSAVLAGVLNHLQKELSEVFARAVSDDAWVCTVYPVLTSEPISQEDLETMNFRPVGDIFVHWAPEPLPDLRTLEIPDFAKKPNWPTGWLLTLESGETVQVVSALGPNRIEFSSLEIRDKDGNVFGIQWNPNMRFTQPETP